MSKNQKTNKKKLDMIDKITKQLQKKFGDEAVNYLGNKDVQEIERVSSGIVIVDNVVGGGYPIGRIIEVYGDASTGKTTCCYHAIAEAQKAYPDRFCAFVDSEFAFDVSYASALGVNTSELVVSQPDNGQEAFAIVQGLMEAGAVLIVVDSVAAMVPREEEEEEDYARQSMGVQARMMSKALRKLTPIVSRCKSILMFTNQTREKIGVLFGSPECVTVDTYVEVME